MNSKKIKGFNDFIGAEALKRKKIRQIIQDQFELYGFEPAETPIIEAEEFVVGDNSSDDAVRDVYRLEDRGKRKLALRYEFTFQLKRLAKDQKLPYKRYQIGELFRDEPIRAGRTRQFTQMDVDVVGSSIKDEAEILSMTKNIFGLLGIKTKIYVNNRKLINEILVDEKIDEKIRAQVIREIDKLDKLSKKQVADNLKRLGAEKLLKIFDKEEAFFEKYKFYNEVKQLKEYGKDFGVEVIFRPFLARGLAYYNGSVFEVWSEKLNASLCGGGSYLVDNIQSTGISFGLEPIIILSSVKGDNPRVLIISLNQDTQAIELSKDLRENNISVNLLTDKTISKAMEYANTKEFDYSVIVGEKEVKDKKYTLKDMESGKERKLSEEDLIKELKD